jgi:iduronate 2-sulfatase
MTMILFMFTVLPVAAAPPPPTPPPAGAMNVLFIAVDDLRAQFGRSFKDREVLAPNIDKFFLDGGGSAMQRSYVQIAVCGPSRSSMLTGRRPDTTRVGTGARGWCWCQRTDCSEDSLFMTLPTYLRQHGFVTAGNGKLFHPDACKAPFDHAAGDDPRAWSYRWPYGVEANFTQEQWGSIPGPLDRVFNGSMGLSYWESPLRDEEETDGILATGAVERLANFSKEGIGKAGANRPFFMSTGFHKPHLPHIAPKRYFDLYDPETVSLAPNRLVPTGFREENFHADGTFELIMYNINAGPVFKKDHQDFVTPVDESFSRAQRRGYFACVSFVDAQVGRVLTALESEGYKENTIVLLWGDHGWHLGDTNSWGKMTNFESGTRNAMLWRVPGQRPESQGHNTRIVETIDIFPTLLDLTGTPALPKCQGVDQPPTVHCLQGESYAAEFLQPSVTAGTPPPPPPKQFAFSQWPFGKWPAALSNRNPTDPNTTGLREGYTVRSAAGFRYTQYVPYDAVTTFRGNWTAVAPGLGAPDEELYDYSRDPWETTNFAAEANYSHVVAELRAVLREQYAGS